MENNPQGACAGAQGLYPPTRRAVVGFTRHTLGCSCPDEVFQRMDIRRDLRRGAVHLQARIAIGGRLLIYLYRCPEPGRLAGDLAELCREGLRERDEGGFNRLRLVVSMDPASEARETAEAIFHSLAGRDDRVHLHLLDSREGLEL